MKFQIVKGKSATQPYFWRIVESVIKNAGGASVEDLT
jgi:hypothetical protein